MTIAKGAQLEWTVEERLEALETEMLAHRFLLWQMARLLALSAPNPLKAAAALRAECDEHFASLPGDAAEHHELQEAVEGILNSAFGAENEDFTASPPKAAG